MPARSQRHKLYIQGVASNGQTVGQPSGGPTDITPNTMTHAGNLGNGVQVGTFTGVGGSAPYTWQLQTNPYGTYFLLGNALKILLSPPHVTGARSVVVQVTDNQQRSYTEAITVTVT